MLRYADLPSFRHRAAWLLCLGLLAVALHAMAGTGLLRTSMTAGKGETFAAEVCTSHGVVKADSSRTADDSGQPASGVHDCCKLCAATGPLLAASIEIGVPPAPTLAAPYESPDSARPRSALGIAHPPRGPPASA